MILTWIAGGSVIDIDFDATVREEHHGTTVVTEYHVERGADVADHARSESPSITCDVVVTNTPIRVPQSDRNGVDGGFSVLNLHTKSITHLPKILPGVGLIETLIPPGSQTTGVQVLNFDGEMRRTQNVFATLDFLRTSTTLVSIVTPLRVYEDMVIRSITAPRTAGEGDCVTFTIVAKGIRFVDSEVVAVSASSGLAKTSSGSKPGKKPSTKALESTLHTIGPDAGKTFGAALR